MSRSMQQPLSVTLGRVVFTSSGVINLSLHGTLLLKAALGEHMANTGLRSAVLTVASFATGLGPDARAAQIALKVLLELATEALVVYHQQLTGVASLPFVAIVHALRQSMWMCIVVWALDGDPRQTLKLGACNWTFLVLVSCYFQRYTWAAYRQHSGTQQRLPRPPPLTTVLEGVPGFVTGTTSPAEPLSQAASSSVLNRSNTIPYSTQQSGWESEAAGLEMETCSPHPSAPGTPTVTSIGDLLGHYGNTKQGKEWVAAMQRFSDDGAGSDAKHSAQSLYGQAHMHLQQPPSLRQPSGSSGATGSRQGKGHQSQSSTVTATSSNRSSTELGLRFGDVAGQQKPPGVPVETAMDSVVHAGNRALDVSVIQSITPVISSEDSDQMGPAAEAARRAVDGPAEAERPAAAGQDSPFQQQSAEAMSDVGTELPPVGPATPGADVTGAAAAEAADQAAGGQPAASINAPVDPTAPTDAPAQEQARDVDAPAATTRDMPLHTQQHVAEAGGDAAVEAAITRRLPSVPHQLEALIRRIDDRRRRPYIRKTDRESKAVHVKINGIELEQLPADLSGMLHEQLRNGMPGVMMTSMALRSGCVIIALDLLSSPEDGEAAGGSGMADLMSRIMQGHVMGRALEDGATMSIQMPDEITACQWDTDSNGYWVVDEEEGALDPSSLKAYHTISTLPTVISLPETGDDGDTCRELIFSVELQLPGNCHLYGWQPAGVAAPAGSDVLLQTVPQAGGVVDAMLLARRLDGGYLPVVVERIVREDTDGSDASQHTTARLVVTVDDVAPAALCLELWCQGQGTGPPAPDGRIEPGHELLVSHMPLLVLPSSWKEAAEELQQHIVETGGVQPRNALPPHARDANRQAGSGGQSGCLLEDLGMWLTHPDRVAGTVLSDSAMAKLGDDLLVHAVQHGLGAVASMIVDHMPRIEQQGSGNDASPWLRRVSGSGGCGDGDGMNLLHAAMASGSADVLGQLFRWGARFGGPGWSWSWELEASEGLTALHFTASQPEDICRGMLETITRMLPAAQVHAARNAWLHCQGGVSTTPAELWGMAAHGDGVSFMWATEALEVSSGSLVSKPSSELYNNVTRLAEVATASSMSSGKRSKESSGSPIGSAPAVSALSTTRSPSPAAAALSSRAKTFQLIHWWVVPLLALSALGMYRSSSEGCVQYELMHLGLHALAYLPIMASARGLSWLGDWQAWMLVTHTLDALGYGAKTFLSVHQASVWAAASSSAVNICCVVLISAALNQAPRPHLLVACMFMAYFRSLAYQMVGHPHPLRHALVTDAIALGISTLARARQLRAFQAWLADLLDRRNGPRPTATVPSARTKPPYGMAAVRQASGGF